MGLLSNENPYDYMGYNGNYITWALKHDIFNASSRLNRVA